MPCIEDDRNGLHYLFASIQYPKVCNVKSLAQFNPVCHLDCYVIYNVHHLVRIFMSTKHVLCNLILMRSKGHPIILADRFNEMLLIRILFC